MNPCHFFLWNYLEDRVYCTNSHTVQGLQAEIEPVAEEVTSDMLCDS